MGAPSLDDTFRALADPARRRIIHLLGAAPVSPGALATSLGVSRPAISRQLRVLKQAGLVGEVAHPTDKRGKLIRLKAAPLHAVADWAQEAAAFWDDQLDAFSAFSSSQEARGEP